MSFEQLSYNQEIPQNNTKAQSAINPGRDAHFLYAVVKEGQASVLVADKGALFDKANENLRLRQLGVKLLVSTISTLQEP